jgi:hypothetical protein
MVPADAGEIMADVIGKGDLARLSPEQRVAYYLRTCQSLGLNPLTKPFDYIQLNGKLTLYATKGATDQLRAAHGISIRVISQEVDGDVLVVTVEGTDATGRTDMEIGAVNVGGLRGDGMANARMKALTKAKRRLTLSMSGLGLLDETEIETIPTARAVRVDEATGEILDAPAPARAIQSGDFAVAEQIVATAEARDAETVVPAATRDQLAARVVSLAQDRGIGSRELSRMATELTGKADRRTWTRDDFGALVEHLESMQVIRVEDEDEAEDGEIVDEVGE